MTAFNKAGDPIGIRKTRTPQTPLEHRAPEYQSGYQAGYKAGRTSAQNELMDTRTPRPTKYPFQEMAVGSFEHSTEPNTQRVYNAARQWARRNAPTRRFQCHPHKSGTKITRLK